MSKSPITQVASGPSDPDDPPPKPKALLAALKAGAVAWGDHLLLHNLERWLVCDRVEGWVLVDADGVDRVRIDADTIDLLCRVEPVEGSARVDLHGRSYTIRPVLVPGRGLNLYVGLVS